MKEERNYRAEYEALLKQYEEDKKREEELNRLSTDIDVDDLEKLPKHLKREDWNKAEREVQMKYLTEREKKLNSIIVSIATVLILLTGIFIFISDLFNKTAADIIFIVLGVLLVFSILALCYLKKPVNTIVVSIPLIISGIAVIAKNAIVFFISAPSICIAAILSTTIEKIIPLVRLLRKMKPLKQVCTEKVTAACVDANKKDIYTLQEENIEVIPRYVLVKRRVDRAYQTKSEKIYHLFSPVYELDYNGTKYILCDNYYGIIGTEEGESREILINPKNPQEFYDEKRYKSDAKEIFKTTSIVYMIILLAFLISLTVFLVTNYDLLLD